jgi:hypothetical protein
MASPSHRSDNMACVPTARRATSSKVMHLKLTAFCFVWRGGRGSVARGFLSCLDEVSHAALIILPDAERRIDQATALRTKSSDADAASAQLEQNARKSAFLAADQKDQIKQLISVGKDQVTRAVQYNAHARKLRLQAKSLMSNALSHLKTSELDEKRCALAPQLDIAAATRKVCGSPRDAPQVQHQLG